MSDRFGWLHGALAVGCAALLLTGCTRGPSQAELDAAREQGQQQAEEQQQLEELQDQLDDLQRQAKENKAAARQAERRAQRAERRAAQHNDSGTTNGGTSSGLSGPVTACGDGVYAGANTSCAFALNVAGEYGSNWGASAITAYSPVTGQSYTMSCSVWGGGGHVCTGGNNASVYLP